MNKPLLLALCLLLPAVARADDPAEERRRQPPQESEPEEDVVDEILRKENESATGDPRVMSYEARQSRQPAPDKSER